MIPFYGIRSGPIAFRRPIWISSAVGAASEDKIDHTVNAYLAFRAALLTVLAHNEANTSTIKSLGAPALGTGVGAMPTARAAHQMHAAYVSVFENPEWLQDPTAILLHHENLRSA